MVTKAKQTKKAKTAEPQRLFIPELGTLLEVAEDWPITLHHESRNNDFIAAMGGPKMAKYSYRETGSYKTTIPKGTVLTVDRIYIRSGNKEFSSISFRVHDGKVKGRFWVKLDEANQLLFARKTGTKIRYRVTDTQTQSKRNFIETASRSTLVNKMKRLPQYYSPDFSLLGIFLPELRETIEKEGRWKFTSDRWATIQPVDSKPFLRRESFGGFGNFPTFSGGLNNYAIQKAFFEDFMRILLTSKGVKKLTELLDHLPPRYKYEERGEEI